MSTTVEKVEALDLPPYRPAKAPLTVEHVSALLRRNYTKSDIAKLSNVSPQAVDQFIDRHYDVLHPLIDNTDLILAGRLKANAIGILNSLDQSDIKKSSLMQKATAIGILIDKYRLLSGQSTDNLAIDGTLRAIHSNLFALPDAKPLAIPTKLQGRPPRKR